jgi:membrane-bound lytic murein transglycosylase MltF
MQLLPSTASDHNVNVSKIHLPENNIHAGVKYLSFLLNNYFNEPDMDFEVRLQFALAAYNAGPGRIQQIRNLARKLGYDPNQWLLNCEYAALKIVGKETVRYVRNVQHYYTAIKKAFEHRGTFM